MRSTETASIVAMEEFVVLKVVSEVRVSVELGIPAIVSATTLFIATKDVDDSVLNLFGDGGKRHVLQE